MALDHKGQALDGVLLEIAQQFGAALDVERLLQTVVERVTSVERAERALFALVDREGTVTRAVCHNLVWEGPEHPLPISSTVLQEVLRKREPVLVLDAMNHDVLRHRQSVRQFGLRRIIAVPIENREGTCGVLYVDSPMTSDDSPEAGVARLAAIARLVSTALENARLFEELRFRHQLLGELVHDLRAPLTVMQLDLDLCDRADRLDSKMRAQLRSSVARIGAMVDDTLDLARADSGLGRVAPSPIDLADLVRGQVERLRPVASRSGLSLGVRQATTLPLVAETLPGRVAVVLDNLLFNAFKYARRPSCVEVSLELRPDPAPVDARARPAHPSANLFRRLSPLRGQPDTPYVEITVRNEGSPIEPALLPTLFAPLLVDDVRPGRPASGLGLSIVDQCVRHLGGFVWARSSEESGTTFSFTLPSRIAA